MDTLIIPNWHPLMVHFTVALLTISAVFFVLSKANQDKSTLFENIAKWTLWVGAGITVLTILAGIDAYNTVDHDDVAHKVMKVHRLYAFVTGGAILLFAFWTYKAKAVSTAMIAGSVVVAVMVGATGYLGAELVYRHGLGVMRLPDTSGAGHEHAPGQGHGDSAETPKAGGHEHAPGQGHGDKPAAMPEKEGHEHAEGEGHGDKAAAMPKTEGHEHAPGQGHGDKAGAAAVAADPASVSNALYEALRTGDVATVGKLFADDALIIEGKHAQKSKAAYMNGHMKSDMAALPSITREVLSQEAGRSGDTAWVTTHSRSTGTYKDRTIDRSGREFMVLRLDGSDWKITMVQWGEN